MQSLKRIPPSRNSPIRLSRTLLRKSTEKLSVLKAGPINPMEGIKNGRRPTLPRGDPAVPSARAGLTSLFGMGRGVSPPPSSPLIKRIYSVVSPRRGQRPIPENCIGEKPSSPRLISTTRLNTSPCLHLWPINLVVYQESYPLEEVGDLISRRASRLDAFSGYPFRT